MGLFDAVNINASGLSLERLKLDTISTNIANVNTTKSEDGGPYKKQTVIFGESLKEKELHTSGKLNEKKSFGVKVKGINKDDNVNEIYDPNNPDSDNEGYVKIPNVNLADEMIGLMNTVRTYEANVSAFETSKSMMKKALEITKD